MRRCQRVRARPGENAGEKESCLYGPDSAFEVGGDLREELGRRYVEEHGHILRKVTGTGTGYRIAFLNGTCVVAGGNDLRID